MPKKVFDILIIGSVPKALGAKKEGGVSQVVWKSAKYLKKQGVDLCIGARGEYYIPYQKYDETDIYGITFSFLVFVKTLIMLSKSLNKLPDGYLNKLRLFIAVYFLITVKRRVEFNCLHVHHVTNQIPLAAEILHITTPIVATIHSYTSIILASDERKKNNEIRNINRQLEAVDFVIHVSKSVREQGVKFNIDWEANREKIIFNGIEETIKLSNNDCYKPESPQTLCFVGRLLKRKGLCKLLKALTNDKINVMRSYFIGDGPFKSRIERLKISGVKIYGHLSHDKVLKKMAESDLLVVPSKSESFGLVYMEALSVGTPVIGYHKIIQEFQEKMDLNKEEKQWLIPFNYDKETAWSLVKKINFGLDLKKEKRSTGRNIASKIQATFHWKQVTREYAKVYSEFL